MATVAVPPGDRACEVSSGRGQVTEITRDLKFICSLAVRSKRTFVVYGVLNVSLKVQFLHGVKPRQGMRAY